MAFLRPEFNITSRSGLLPKSPAFCPPGCLSITQPSISRSSPWRVNADVLGKSHLCQEQSEHAGEIEAAFCITTCATAARWEGAVWSWAGGKLRHPAGAEWHGWLPRRLRPFGGLWEILCKTKFCQVYIKMASGKPQCLEENVKQQWTVNNLFSLERKSLAPAMKALVQHGRAIGGSTQPVVWAPAQQKLIPSCSLGGWWAAGAGVRCHQQSRRVPGTFLLVEGSFPCICIPTSAVWVHSTVCTRNFSSWFYFPKIFRSKKLFMFVLGQKTFFMFLHARAWKP